LSAATVGSGVRQKTAHELSWVLPEGPASEFGKAFSLKHPGTSFNYFARRNQTLSYLKSETVLLEHPAQGLDCVARRKKNFVLAVGKDF
jgi:hypothetical protein